MATWIMVLTGIWLGMSLIASWGEDRYGGDPEGP